MDINNANDNDTIDLKKLFSLMIEKKMIVIAIIVICTIIATIVAFRNYVAYIIVMPSNNSNLYYYCHYSCFYLTKILSIYHTCACKIW